MNIVHVVPHINAEASGPSYSVPRLCQALTALEDKHDVTISCLAAAGVIQGVKLSVHPSLPILRKFAVSPRQGKWLHQQSDSVDIIHNHSLWSMVNVTAGCIVPGKHAKLVSSPRGTLSEWALSHNSARKKILWPLQKRVLTRADLLHATSEDEYADIRRLGLRAPVLITPNGIDLPELTDRNRAPKDHILLFISRIHPKKGIENLLDAWSTLESLHEEWTLRIVGPGDASYVNSLMTRASTNGSKRVEFIGPLYAREKDVAYREADLFVLPTHSENFGMVVAEALAQECPAIVSRGAPWAGLETEGCGWWINNSVDTLIAKLDFAMNLSRQELDCMGRKGRAWMERDYSWEAVAQSMEAGYRWLLEGGTPPDCVRVL